MDRFVVRVKDPSELPRDNQLHFRLERPENFRTKLKTRVSLLAAYEIHGRVLPSFRPSLLKLMLNSYSEVAALNGEQQFQGVAPVTWLRYPFAGEVRHDLSSSYISAVDFDSKGIYLASVCSAGLLSIYEFETLYCSAGRGSDSNSTSCIRQIRTHRALEAVRWNPSNEDEVACAAAGSNKIYFYDVACSSSLPSEMLRVKSPHGSGCYGGESVGLFDLAFFNHGSSRVLACGKDGHVHIWDRRASTSSYAALPVPGVAGALNSVQLSKDEQMVYSGSEGGFIHSWDLRGGRHAAAFVTSAKGYIQPLGAVKIENTLRSISSLRAQTDIGTSAVHAISLNPACGKQLAFHLNCGWSGVLDLTTLDATHIHCPPPPWLDNMHDEVDPATAVRCPRTVGQLNVNSVSSPKCVVRRRRPVWLSSWPVYAVGSGSEFKVHMLDFTPGPKSRYSVHHCRSIAEEEWQVELRTTEAITSIAAHPLNDTLVAGCQGGKLLLIGQNKTSISGQEIDERATE